MNAGIGLAFIFVLSLFRELFQISSDEHTPCVEVGLAGGGEMVGLLKMPGGGLG